MIVMTLVLADWESPQIGTSFTEPFPYNLKQI